MNDMTLTEFLLARIAEDEAVARSNLSDWLFEFWPEGTIYDDPEWAGIMIEAWIEASREPKGSAYRSITVATERDLKWVANRYAEHSDFDPAWRP